MRILFLGCCLLLLSLHIKQVRGEFLHINKCTNCTVSQENLVRRGAIKASQTILSQCFVDFMMEREMVQTEARTNQEVLASIVMAQVQVDVATYWTLKKVHGYTLNGVNKIWINRKYMKGWNECEIAAFLGHEATHKIGYGHDKYATKRRPFSVPYSVTAAIQKCCVR